MTPEENIDRLLTLQADDARESLPDFLKKLQELPTTLSDRGSTDHPLCSDTLTTAPPRKLGKYELLEEIGHGGMGTVYKAMHTVLANTVAVKVLPAERLQNPQAVARFLREGRAAARLQHANIVRALDADQADGRHFLVMDWLDGQDLARYVRDHGPLPVAEACNFIRQAALGLDYAHRHALVHRDVKPSNLLLTTGDDGRPLVKVLDLGLALLRDAAAPADGDVTSSGQIMGTYDYIAPEQTLEAHTVDARADIYSLGCTFYFLLTGRAPFAGKNEVHKLLAHQKEAPPPISTIRPEVPPEVAALVEKMIAKDPAARYQTMAEVANATTTVAASCQLAGSEGGNPKPTSWQLVATNQVVATKAGPAPRRRRPVLVAAAILLGLVAVVAATLAIIRISTPEGDYVIDTDDPDFSFQVSKGAVTLEDRKTKRTYKLKGIEHKKGEFELEVTEPASDLVFNSKTFSIKRGEKVALKAWFDRKGAEVAKAGPVDDAWLKLVATMPPENQVEAVAAKLKELNPGFDGKIESHRVGDGVVYDLRFPSDNVKDISAVRALSGLRILLCSGRLNGQRSLADLSPLKGMKLTMLWCNVSQVADLSPLRGMQLTELGCETTAVKDLSPLQDMNLTVLDIRDTAVMDLSPLKGMPLTTLNCLRCPVSDLAPLNGMPLNHLDCQGTKVTDLSPLKEMKLTDLRLSNTLISDLSPLKDIKLKVLWCRKTKVADLSLLKGMPLRELECDFHRERDSEILRSIKTLERINGKPAAEFWKEVDATRSRQPLTGHKARINSLSFSPDGKLLLSASHDATMRLWDLDKGTELKQLKRMVDHKFHSAALSADATFAVAAIDDRYYAYAVFDLKTGGHEGYSVKEENLLHGSVALDADGRRALAANSEGLIGLVDTRGWKPFRFFRGHTGAVTWLDFCAKGSRFLSSGTDKTVRLWDATKDANSQLCTLAGSGEWFPAVAISPDGRYVAMSNKESLIQLWDVSDVKKPTKVGEFQGHGDHVLCLAFAPDGRRLLSGGRDKLVRLWNVETRAELARFEGHSEDVTCVAFSPRADQAVSGSLDHTIRVWQVPKP